MLQQNYELNMNEKHSDLSLSYLAIKNRQFCYTLNTFDTFLHFYV